MHAHVLFAVSNMYDYLVYALWLTIPASVVSLVPFVVIILLCCSVKFRSSTAGMVTFLLGDLVEKKEEEDGKKYLIRGHPLKGRFLSMVTVCTFMITSCALMTFWYEFLVDMTYICDPNHDCYPVPAPSFRNSEILDLRIPPIVNCSDYETLPDNMTIICFTFTFDYPQAFAAAGGVFAFAVSGTRAIIGLMIWLKSRRCKCCLLVLLSIVYAVVGIDAVLLSTFFPVFKPLIGGLSNVLQLTMYIATFFVGFVLLPMVYLQQSQAS